MDEKCGNNVADVTITLLKQKIAELSCLMEKLFPTSVPLAVQTTKTSETGAIVPKNDIISKETLFLKALGILVIKKYDPLLVYAHCHYETAGFTKLIGDFNYAGMKPPAYLRPPNTPGWNGKIINRQTHDVINGAEKQVYDNFCDFISAESFMIFYDFQIQRVYSSAFQNRQNPQAYIYWLAKIGWGQDEDYEKELFERYTQLKATSNGIFNKMEVG